MERWDDSLSPVLTKNHDEHSPGGRGKVMIKHDTKRNRHSLRKCLFFVTHIGPYWPSWESAHFSSLTWGPNLLGNMIIFLTHMGSQLTFLRKCSFLVTHRGPQLTFLWKCSFFRDSLVSQLTFLTQCSFFMTHRVPKITFFRKCSFLWLTRGLNWPIEIQHMRKWGYKTEKVLIFCDRQTDTFLLYIEIRIATLVLTVMWWKGG